MVSFRGQKELGPRPDRSPLGVQNFWRASPPLSYVESPRIYLIMNEEHFTFHLQYKHSGTFTNRANRKCEEFFLPPKSENVRPHSSNAIENATPLQSIQP